jgi:hypothetical protein
MLESISIVNYAEYTERLAQKQLAKPAKTFNDYLVTPDITNPVVLDIIDDDSPTNRYQIAAGDRDTIMVLVNISNGATNRSFKTLLEDLWVWDVDSSIRLDVVDQNGNALDKMGTSDPFTVLPSSPEESFRNYPNPFGRDEDETTIVFYLEENSDVEIRIFTLTGGLVWTYKEQNIARGLRTHVKWNGKNDRAKTVLNGVYLCQIQIKSSGEKFLTKIAYIK